MKKVSSIIIVFLLALSLGACGQSGNTRQNNSDSDSNTVEETVEETADVTEEEAEDMTQEKNTSNASDISFDFETRSVTLNSGYEMPINGIGTYNLLDNVAVSSVSEALSRGVRLIDTASIYHNEAEVGEAVRNSGIPREEIFVTTKLYPNQFDDPEKAIDESLERLDIEYIDLMLLHHPGDSDGKSSGRG